MWFKQVLTRIFHRDFTARKMTAREKAIFDKAKEDEANGLAPQAWSSDCSWSEKIILGSTSSVIRHLCCDGTLSAVSNRRDACVGHYGVCCSK